MRPASTSHPCGFLNLDKPIGLTSRDVVDRVLGSFGRPRPKVGHAGTLDPLASGVLVVAVGAATRLIDRVQRQPKTYRAAIRLGATSDTLDADGTITPVADPPIPTEAMVRGALARLVGTIEQRPPIYSALRVEGKRAYDLARRGEEVSLAPREVRVDRIDLIRYEWPTLEIEVECGAGTYIRSIARDVGEALGCGGLIEVLRRTRIGPFRVEEAIAPEPEALGPEGIAARIRPMRDAVADLPAMVVTAEQVEAVRFGKAIVAGPGTPAPGAWGEVALIGPSGELVAIAEADPASGRCQPRRVLAPGDGGGPAGGRRG